MSNEIQISIILSVGDSLEASSSTLINILEQRLSRVEIIVVYPQRNEKLIAGLQNHSSIILMQAPNLTGPGVCMNLGLAIAKGKYICFVQPGDLFYQGAFQSRQSYLAKNRSVAVVGGIAQTDSPKESWDTNSLLMHGSHKEIIVNLLFGNCLYFSSLLFRAEFLQKFCLRFGRQSQHTCEYDFVLRCAARGKIVRLDSLIVCRNTCDSNEVIICPEIHDIKLKQLQNFDCKFSPNQRRLHLDAMNLTTNSEPNYYYAYIDWFGTLLKINDKTGYYSAGYLSILFYNIISLIQHKIQYGTCSSTNRQLGGWSIEKSLFDFIGTILHPGDSVVELGSGYGTSQLLSQYDVRSVEHHPLYSFKRASNHTCYYAPITNGWYRRKMVKAALSGNPMLLLIDGPPGELRGNIVENIDLFHGYNGDIIFDDVNRDQDKSAMEAFCNELGFEYQVIQGTNKSFGYCQRTKLI